MKEIPKNAHKVFSGIIYSVWQWEQELFDGSTATFECISRPDTVIIIPLVEGKIYIQKEEQPGRPAFSTLPAGRCESDDVDPRASASRELLEETGLASDEWVLLKHNNRHGKTVSNIYVFIARHCKKIAEPKLDPGEKIHTTELLSFDELIVRARDTDTFENKELEIELLKASYDPIFKELLRERIFGK